MFLKIFIRLLYIYFTIFIVDSTLIQMRVVRDTANYGYAGSNLMENDAANQLVASVSPSNFSGPELMEKLLGKCYNLTEERYRYVFCPFQNVTQYEVSARWNAYQGILGIWSHWEIENNNFSLMVFKNGDQCGDIDRTVKVSLQCGKREELMNVTEPSRCQYSAIFKTRYVCHQDALLVYPRLDEVLRKEWDDLLTEFHYGDITQKGYDVGLQKIFKKAGLLDTVTKSVDNGLTIAYSEDKKFMDLLTCNKEYKKLHEEIERLNLEVETLKLMMDFHKMNNKTTKPQR